MGLPLGLRLKVRFVLLVSRVVRGLACTSCSPEKKETLDSIDRNYRMLLGSDGGGENRDARDVGRGHGRGRWSGGAVDVGRNQGRRSGGEE
jgi:hypothetical protein